MHARDKTFKYAESVAPVTLSGGLLRDTIVYRDDNRIEPYSKLNRFNLSAVERHLKINILRSLLYTFSI